MAKYKVTNTSNIRKYTYGHQLEPGETKELDLLVKEAEEIPSQSFHVERLDEPESSQEEESAEDEQPTEEVEADSEASLEKNPENQEDSGGE